MGSSESMFLGQESISTRPFEEFEEHLQSMWILLSEIRPKQGCFGMHRDLLLYCSVNRKRSLYHTCIHWKSSEDQLADLTSQSAAKVFLR